MIATESTISSFPVSNAGQLRIKVCGMKLAENIADVALLAPDFLGFIFYSKSARYVGDDFDAQQLRSLPPDVKRVGVFVNEATATILRSVAEFGLDLVQLHGEETPEQCAELQAAGLAVMKAFPVCADFDFPALLPYVPHCDYFLFDTKGEKRGGNGAAFDWAILEKYNLPVPYFLAGGLTISHLEQLRQLRLPGLFAVDLNSRFELAPGHKDVGQLRHMLDGLRQPNPSDGKKTHESANSTLMNTTFQPNARGYYGQFGGAFIPEMLYPNVEELRERYLTIMEDPAFQREMQELLRDYVGRPTPLFLARRLSEKYNTNIYLKREDLCHTGAHKINNTVGQILLARRLGKTRIIAETGAGQHGVATATVCALMGMECIVYMGKIDTERQRPNVERMRLLGAEVRPVTSGSQTLKDATNEAIRDWISNPVDTHYIIGSVVGPHPYPDLVARLQSVISEEMRKQLLEKTGSELPDYVVACVGGGSNAAGAFYHFLDEPSVQLVAVEAAGHGIDSGHSAATSVLGKPGIIHGSRTLLMQDEHGQITEPYSLSAGLDYPGVGPLHAHLAETGRARFISIEDEPALLAVAELSRLEGIIPALETAHALAAIPQLGAGPDEVVVINLSGRGDKDLDTYLKYADKLR